MKDLHYQYFLALDEDFVQTIRYAELTEANFKTYSIEFTKLLFSICSEVEIVCKQMCSIINPSQDYSHLEIDKLGDTFLTKYPKFAEVDISVPKLSDSIRPWERWDKFFKNKEGKEQRATPFWWQNYNHVKHSRHTNYHLASQKSVLYALAGLYTLLIYWFYEESNIMYLFRSKAKDFET